MSRMLAGTSRYFDHPGARVVPIGITGSEELQPVGRETVCAARVVIRVGPALSTDELKRLTRGNRRLEVDIVGLKVAELLPERYRGYYGTDAPELVEARSVADAL